MVAELRFIMPLSIRRRRIIIFFKTPCLCATRLDATATGLMSAGTETVAERFISFDMDLCKDNKTRDAFEISGNVCTLSNC